jgi:hypothetical protein
MPMLRFKTNLKCKNCILNVTPLLESNNSIEDWELHLNHPDKLLEVNATDDVSEEIITMIKKAGYQIDRL